MAGRTRRTCRVPRLATCVSRECRLGASVCTPGRRAANPSERNALARERPCGLQWQSADPALKAVTPMRTWKPRRALLLLGVALVTPAACTGARLLAEWSAVQATEPGRRVRLLLYQDRTPSGSLKVDGRFVEATSDSVTLVLKNGSTRTFESRTVRRVSRRRPFFKRTKAWVITGLALTVVGIFASADTDLSNLLFDFTDINIGRSLAIWFAPAYALAAIGSTRIMIYNVPRKHRSP